MQLGELIEKMTTSDRLVIINAAGQVIYRGYAANFAHGTINPLRRVKRFGLYVEMKWQKNKTTDKQDWWLDQLRQQGYETAVCWTAEDAMDTIAGYLGVMEQTGRKVEL